ncbi:bestrophin-like domain [Terracidiphilus gabretensis]|jgi:hypothetical protein|uniref:bestrophin-like domain n=1 Tax=Terracidiphilus gabretensis TaxID=1577687 RepID=UPI00071B9CA1|nr:hypothetical protein [Terracidiphilus gabretensis]
MLMRYPVLVFALSLVGFWLSVLIGAYLLGRIRPVKESERQDLDFVVGSSLTMLALIIGFAFSMAVTRYDMRKNYEEEEANAIGTEYARADLLPGDAAVRVRQLLVQYLDQRMLFYTVRDEEQLNSIAAETTKLQNEMWSTVQSAAREQPTPVAALAVAGMNDVLNRQGYTQAAWWNRLPTGAWILMIVLAVSCSILTGYRALDRRSLLFPVLPFMVAIAFFLIADIDSPRRGIIRVQSQNMESLKQSLR